MHHLLGALSVRKESLGAKSAAVAAPKGVHDAAAVDMALHALRLSPPPPSETSARSTPPPSMSPAGSQIPAEGSSSPSSSPPPPPPPPPPLPPPGPGELSGPTALQLARAPRGDDASSQDSSRSAAFFVQDPYGQVHRLALPLHFLVSNVKNALQELIGIPAAEQRLFVGGRELRSKRTLHDSGVRDGCKIVLQRRGAHAETLVDLYGGVPATEQVRSLCTLVRQGFNLGLKPQLSMEGTGGTYMLRDRTRTNVAVFKPLDEEPFAPNNPRGHVGALGQPGIRAGVLTGEGHVREVAASLLDANRFCGVPATGLVEIRHPAFTSAATGPTAVASVATVAAAAAAAAATAATASSSSPAHAGGRGGGPSARPKVGALQEYVQHDDLAGDLSCSLFPVHQVHRIGILDIRLVNLDRNEANVLVRRRTVGQRSKVTLVPIDHSYSLPDTLDLAWSDWVWLSWPQAKEPFSKRSLRYIAALDPEDDARMLSRVLSIRPPCLRLMRVAVHWLKRAAAAGLSLFDIGSVICREEVDKPSTLENVCWRAAELAHASRANVRLRPALAGDAPPAPAAKPRRAVPPPISEEREPEGRRSPTPASAATAQRAAELCDSGAIFGRADDDVSGEGPALGESESRASGASAEPQQRRQPSRKSRRARRRKKRPANATPGPERPPPLAPSSPPIDVPARSGALSLSSAAAPDLKSPSPPSSRLWADHRSTPEDDVVAAAVAASSFNSLPAAPARLQAVASEPSKPSHVSLRRTQSGPLWSSAPTRSSGFTLRFPSDDTVFEFGTPQQSRARSGDASAESWRGEGAGAGARPRTPGAARGLGASSSREEDAQVEAAFFEYLDRLLDELVLRRKREVEQERARAPSARRLSSSSQESSSDTSSSPSLRFAPLQSPALGAMSPFVWGPATPASAGDGLPPPIHLSPASERSAYADDDEDAKLSPPMRSPPHLLASAHAAASPAATSPRFQERIAIRHVVPSRSGASALRPAGLSTRATVAEGPLSPLRGAASARDVASEDCEARPPPFSPGGRPRSNVAAVLAAIVKRVTEDADVGSSRGRSRSLSLDLVQSRESLPLPQPAHAPAPADASPSTSDPSEAPRPPPKPQ